jgi:hypothetical protein
MLILSCAGSFSSAQRICFLNLSSAQFLYIVLKYHRYMSKKKSRFSKDKSDKGTDKSEKEGESAKQKKPYDRGEGPQNLGRERGA